VGFAGVTRGWGRVGRWLTIGLVLLVTGCGARADRIEACRGMMGALLDDAVQGAVTIDHRSINQEETITLIATEGEAHQVICRFTEAGAGVTAAVLTGVMVDGATVDPIKLVLLGHPLRVLVMPTDVTAPVVIRNDAQAVAFFAQQIINGGSLGAVLALIAIGYSLVYGILGAIQFAYGGLFAIGAYLAIILITVIDDTHWLPITVTLAVVALLAAALTAMSGAAIERMVYRPLRTANRLTLLIAAIGLAIVLENFLQLTQGTGNRWLRSLFSGRFTLFEGGGFSVLIGTTQVAIFVAVAVIAIGLSQFMIRTRLGRAYRACADDRSMAALLGVDVDRVIMATFAAGAALAAIAGLVHALYYGEADASMGYLIGFKALTAALLGGFGSLPGAVVGGFAIGLIEVFWTAYVGASYKDVAIFCVLCLLLIYRPYGLLGKPEGEGGWPLRR